MFNIEGEADEQKTAEVPAEQAPVDNQ